MPSRSDTTDGIEHVPAFDGRMMQAGPNLVVVTTRFAAELLDTTGLSIYLDIVDGNQALANAAGSADPATGLRAVAALRKLVEHLEALHVRNARAHGWPWQAIADALGVTRQAVHQKHTHRTRD